MMMTNIRRIMISLAVLVTAAAPASAQVYTAVRSVPRAWLGIGYNEVVRQLNTQRVSVVTITNVEKNSPAEKAGVMAGDTVLRVNDFRATTEIIQSMGASLEPGDTVRMVIRRNGKDRELAIAVAKRPIETIGFQSTPSMRVYRYDPDSVRHMTRIFVDSMYAGMDTARMRMFRIDTTGGFRTFLPDSTLFGMPGTVFKAFEHDSLLRRLPGSYIFSDSARAFMTRPFGVDSLMRVLPGYNMTIEMPRGGAGFGDGSPNMVFRSMVRGENAFAGAELADVNAELGKYFGTKAGVLVLNVPEGTPAARAGLEPGDIITRVDGTAVSSMVQVRRSVDLVKRGAPIRLEIVRQKKTQTLQLQRD